MLLVDVAHGRHRRRRRAHLQLQHRIRLRTVGGTPTKIQRVPPFGEERLLEVASFDENLSSTRATVCIPVLAQGVGD